MASLLPALPPGASPAWAWASGSWRLNGGNGRPARAQQREGTHLLQEPSRLKGVTPLLRPSPEQDQPCQSTAARPRSFLQGAPTVCPAVCQVTRQVLGLHSPPPGETSTGCVLPDLHGTEVTWPSPAEKSFLTPCSDSHALPPSLKTLSRPQDFLRSQGSGFAASLLPCSDTQAFRGPRPLGPASCPSLPLCPQPTTSR